MNLISMFFQSLYPTLCRGCSCLIKQDDIFCSRCYASLQPIPSVIVPVTQTVSMKVFAVSAYKDPLKVLVRRKFYGDVLASQQLARLMLAWTPLSKYPIDCLVPVPLHWSRYASRGFNQAHEIAKVIGSQLNIPVISVARRTRKTTFQWKLSSADRHQNVKQAFDTAHWYVWQGGNDIKGKHVLLVDDLFTTGATLIHVAKVLVRHKPASLTAVVGCRAV